MRFYIDQGAGMESRPYDTQEIKRFLKVRGAKNIREARKYGWSNMPKVVTFDMSAGHGQGIYMGLYQPNDGALYQWAWDNGLFIHAHWNY
jgi:hypothetical protein